MKTGPKAPCKTVCKTPLKLNIGIVAGCLIVALTIAEWTLGAKAKKNHLDELARQDENWAIKNFRSADARAFIPLQKKQQRVFYLSNSHAFTGGRISIHLQRYMDALYPDTFEVLDVSAPGIFAPDMLQRGARILDYQPDIVIIGAGYISFSARMTLALQASSAKSFFNPGIAAKLGLDFWADNFDLGLYADTLASASLNLIRYRSRLRKQYLEPMATWLQWASGSTQAVFTLNVDASGRWRFPQGYDQNLFQWHLYAGAGNRAAHFRSLTRLVDILQQNGVKTIVFNEPIDFFKSVYSHSASDHDQFRQTFRDAAAKADHFIDYEDYFPKKLSTYDALHPSLLGARLHALDLLLHLTSQGFIPPLDKQVVQQAAADSYSREAFKQQLENTVRQQHETSTFLRLDISDPDNLNNLFATFHLSPPDDASNMSALYKIAALERYQALHSQQWQHGSDNDHPVDPALWRNVYAIEMQHHIERTTMVKAKLSSWLESRLIASKIGKECDNAAVKSSIITTAFDLKIFKQTASNNQAICSWYFSQSGKMIAFEKYDPVKQQGFRRIDVLGNGSFVYMQSIKDKLFVPAFLLPLEALSPIGI